MAHLLIKSSVFKSYNIQIYRGIMALISFIYSCNDQITSRFIGELWLYIDNLQLAHNHITSRFIGELWLTYLLSPVFLNHITSRFIGELWLQSLNDLSTSDHIT